jgi:hypothetical protein
VYDKKDDIKLSKEITFPFTATNFNRQTKECFSKEELLNHIICRDELKIVTQILSAKVHPEIFIDDDIYVLISEFMRFKRYGIDFLYHGGINEIPSIVLQAFDIIQNILDKDESDRLKAIKEKK